MALMPVWTGLFTGGRSSTRGAMTSTGRVAIVVGSGPLPSSGSTQRVDHAADQLGPDGHRRDAPGAADLVALLDLGVRARRR